MLVSRMTSKVFESNPLESNVVARILWTGIVVGDVIETIILTIMKVSLEEGRRKGEGRASNVQQESQLLAVGISGCPPWAILPRGDGIKLYLN